MPHSAQPAVAPIAPSSLSPATALLLVGVVAALHIAAALSPGGFLDTRRLVDPDSWARALRVLDLWEGAGWFDETIAHLNAPAGLSLHWTRPLDLLILLPAKVLHGGFGVSPRDAVLSAGAWVCPALHACCAVAAAWAARAVWTGVGPLFAGLLVAGNPAALSYSAAGRADHHTLILLAGIVALGWAARAAARPASESRAAWLAGASAGAGVWISPEALLFAAPVLAGFGALWVAEGRPGLPGRGAAAQGLRASLGFALAVAAAVAAEHPRSAWLNGEYDKVSAQHVAMGALGAAVFGAAGRLSGGAARRAALGGSAAAAAACALLALWPQALRASLAGVDAGAAEHFLPTVMEMRAIDFSSAPRVLEEAPPLLGPGLVAALAFALSAPAWRRKGTLAAAVPLGLALAVALVAAARHIRFALDLAAPAALVAAGLPALALGLRRPGLRVPAALLAASAAFGVPALGGLGGADPGAATAGDAPPGTSAGDRRCGVDALAALRPADPSPGNRGAAGPVLLANFTKFGPELAWRTSFRLVGAPYHRGGEAIADTVAFFSAEDDARARAVAERRRVSMVLFCAAADDQTREASLSHRLRRGEAPDWMRPVPLPGAPAGVLLFSVAVPEAGVSPGG